MALREWMTALWNRWLTIREAEEKRWREDVGETDPEGPLDNACDTTPSTPSLEELVAARQEEGKRSGGSRKGDG